MKFRREVSEGMMYPRFYGKAYFDYYRGKTVCYPIPFNMIASAWRSLVVFFKNPPQLEMERIVEEVRDLRRVNTLLRSHRYELQRRIKRLSDEIRDLSDDNECPECFCDPCECEEEW